ncbi:hypothetical protein [Calidifontibacter indicus]|uniref:hypothetical protein n=1 Tax=Calidifontibacter indicus TaxID=419650 RepID=UPI003D74750A
MGKNAQRRAAQRHPRTAARTTYWHGGWPDLKPGTVLVGRAEAAAHGIDPARYDSAHDVTDPDLTDPNRVYFSSSREFARAFAARRRFHEPETGVVYNHGALYRVEPIGDIEIDPDFQRGAVSWCAPQARIVAVEDPNVMMDIYEANSRIGPHMCWSDNSPIYSTNGVYRLSPEQKAAGMTLRSDNATLPWVPVELLNADLAGHHPADRPQAERHPQIRHQAAGSVRVWSKHRTRAQALMNRGVTFGIFMPGELDQVNALLAPIVIRPDDNRVVVVARNSSDSNEMLGACVAAVLKTPGGQVVMCLERITVVPTWRDQGLGSVLLTSVQLVLPTAVHFAFGHCPESVAPFFAQCGFTALAAGTPLPVPMGKTEDQIQPFAHANDSWFYRQGRI